MLYEIKINYDKRNERNSSSNGINDKLTTIKEYIAIHPNKERRIYS